MKKYNKILEAINRGINLALDDYENEEIVNQTNSSIIKVNSDTRKLVDLKTKYTVDLGLPSGTLWCNYNLGVNPKKYSLDLVPNWNGDYYAWGDIKTRTKYDWPYYIHANSDWNRIIKYCDQEYFWEYDCKPDMLTHLQLQDDAAYQNMHIHNFKFNIPTRKQFKELIVNTKCVWEENYDGVEGLKGCRLISKINDKEIFFPAAGYMNSNIEGDYDNIACLGEFGYYWSSDLSNEDSCNACYFNVFENGVDLLEDGNRASGFSIRPVINL